MIKSESIILVLVLIINFSIFTNNYHIVYSLYSENNTSNNVYSSINKSDSLNISMRFEPAIPKIYQQTKILFQVNQLNGSAYHKNLTATVTILDKEGGLYKFGNLKMHDGKFFINYIFQNNLQNKIIVQLYNNNSGFALTSFDFQIPKPFTPVNNNSGNFFTDLFKNFFK